MNIPDWKYNASVGWRQTWNRYFYSYCEATDQMYNSVVEHELTDTLSYPFLFLLRHTLELGFKANIHALSKYSEKDYGMKDNEIQKGHILRPLHKAMIDHFEALFTDIDKSDPAYLSFHELSKKLGKLVSIFNRIDKGSFAFRYPVTVDGSQSTEKDEVINLKDIKEKYDESIVLLKHTQDVLDDLFRMIDQFREEMSHEYRDY